ncbi:MAG TPA: hypothetical protein VGN16_20870 [Acidobacteriaceae bacterium]|jgi:hypothetical protein
MARNSQKKLTKKTAKAKGTGSASSKASAKKDPKPAAKKASKIPGQKAKKLAKVKSTGGYGFAFEDKVAGQLLIRMLDGLEPWNIKGSRVERLSFQVAASGWKLDDLLLEMRNDAGPLFCSVSVKSAAYLTKDGFKSEFVSDAWAQWSDGAPFDRTRDYMALAVGSLSATVQTAWEDIERRSITADPKHLVDQLTKAGSSSATERKIFKSLLGVASKPQSNLGAARLIKRLRVRHFDNTVDVVAGRDCTLLLRFESPSIGNELWIDLQTIAAKYRISGGTLDLPELLSELRNKYKLKDHPNFRATWRSMNQRSLSNCNAVHSVSGQDTLVVFADSDIDGLKNAKSRHVTAVVGDSGTGKSSIVKSDISSRVEEINMIWLSQDELDKPNQHVLASSLGIADDLPMLVGNSMKPVYLVLDAAEQFSPLALERVSEIVRAMQSVPTLDYKVFLTTQPSYWSRIRLDVGAWKTEGVQELPFAGAPFENVLSAISQNSVALSLLVRPELRRVFTNLATLDQVLKVATVQATTPSKGWIGETEIIDWIWVYWCGTDAAQYQRAGLIELLGHEDASLGPVVPMAKLPFEVKGILGDFRIASLTLVNSQGVRFSHEVVGDWARYHSLKGQGPERHSQILEHVKNPRWQRAIRLYSQSLLEQNEGLLEWENEFGAFGHGDSDNQVAADIFSDSLLLATNSLELLTRVWPSLISNAGSRLKRLLKRLLVVGTLELTPHTDLGEEFSDAVSLLWRLPITAYWDGLLQALLLKVDDVTEFCTEEAGQLCAFYLRTVPPGYGRRRLAAQLALALGNRAKKNASENRRFSYGHGVSQAVFEAVLRAGKEFPDEVAELALFFAERKPVIDLQPETTKIVYSTGFSSRMFGRTFDPWPDGPKRRVDEAFRDAVLTTDSLLALMSSRPDTAQEVILACCIEEPQNEYDRSHSLRLDESGFAFWHNHLPAMYFTGPWLLFLRTSPAHALKTILRLIEFATDRWADGYKAFTRSAELPAFKILFDGTEKNFVGDGNVYNWHSYMSDRAVVVESALMALEKWFYERIDKKEEIADDLQQILAESRSASVLGLLVSVGLYHLPLFQGSLLPLFSNSDLFMTQRSAVMNTSWSFLFDVTWGRYGAKISAEVRVWFEMPHRRSSLLEVARWCLMFDPATSVRIEAFRASWEAEALASLDKGAALPATTAYFFAQFTKSNYVMRDAGNGQVSVELVIDEGLQNRLDSERKRPELSLMAFALIAKGGRAIDQDKKLSPAEALETYNQLQAVVQSDMADGTFELYKHDAIAGGLSALLTASGDFLEQRPDARQFCMVNLLKLAKEELPAKEFDSDRSASDGADLFLGSAALHLIKSGNSTPELWRILLRAVLGYHYQTTQKIMQLAYRDRSNDEVRFYELANALCLWAVVRGPASAIGHRNDPNILRPYQELLALRFLRSHFKARQYSAPYLLKLNHRFARKTLSGTPNWEWHEQRMELLETNPGMLGGRERLHRYETYLDLELLKSGFGFLGVFAGLRSEDAPRLRSFFELLFALELSLLPNSSQVDSAEFETQYDFDDWIMLVAGIYYATLEIEDAMQSVAAPILSLGAGAHRWIGDFINGFLLHAPSLCLSQEGLADRWRALIDYTETSPRWDYDKVGLRYYLEHLNRDLLGFTGHPPRAAADNLAGALVILRPELEKWCDKWLSDTDFSAPFARFISAVKSPDMVAFGLTRLAQVLPSPDARSSRQKDLNEALMSVVQYVWKSHRSLTLTPSETGDSFRSVLAYLTAQLIPEAIDLQAKIAHG